MNGLIQYEAMRVAVEKCARIDEARDLHDKAAALQAYARQRDDKDLEVWVAEIKLRASVRIGEIVRELDVAKPGGANERGERGGSTVTQGGQSKSDAIAEAGLSRKTAYEYQELAGGREERAFAGAKAGMEVYFAKARAEQQPATMAGLKAAVREAVHATLGPRPERAKPEVDPMRDIKPISQAWCDWTFGIARVSELKPDMVAINNETPTQNMRDDHMAEARKAYAMIGQWIEIMENYNVKAA